MGEVVLVPTAPAIANAIYNAVGISMKDLPITRERLFHALKASYSRQDSKKTVAR